MNRGKEKCEQLKRIRELIAAKYRLDYTPTECTHQGPCRGTCPACDAELKDLQRQLDARGIKEVVLTDVQQKWEELMDLQEMQISCLQGDRAADYDEAKDERLMRTEGYPHSRAEQPSTSRVNRKEKWRIEFGQVKQVEPDPGGQSVKDLPIRHKIEPNGCEAIPYYMMRRLRTGRYSFVNNLRSQ